jgi:hypothetical protein
MAVQVPACRGWWFLDTELRENVKTGHVRRSKIVVVALLVWRVWFQEEDDVTTVDILVQQFLLHVHFGESLDKVGSQSESILERWSRRQHAITGIERFGSLLQNFVQTDWP